LGIKRFVFHIHTNFKMTNRIRTLITMTVPSNLELLVTLLIPPLTLPKIVTKTISAECIIESLYIRYHSHPGCGNVSQH